MKAAWYDCVGSAREVLQWGDMPDPLPAAGEVRVRLQWSGVNPSDVKSRAGLRSKEMPFARVVPHSDGAGVIDAVGEGADASRLGQRVWVWNAGWGRAMGTASQSVCLPQAQAVHLPEGVSGEAGACMGIPGLTAMHAVLANGGVAGKTVLVQGGAGAVGHYAVQFASRLGAARVMATVSTPQKAELALAAGADEVVNYRTEDLGPRVRELTNGQGADFIIEVDAAGNGARYGELLTFGGKVVVYGSGQAMVGLPFRPLIMNFVTMYFFIVYRLPDDLLRLVFINEVYVFSSVRSASSLWSPTASAPNGCSAVMRCK